jgi:hypothetical protein
MQSLKQQLPGLSESEIEAVEEKLQIKLSLTLAALTPQPSRVQVAAEIFWGAKHCGPAVSILPWPIRWLQLLRHCPTKSSNRSRPHRRLPRAPLRHFVTASALHFFDTRSHLVLIPDTGDLCTLRKDRTLEPVCPSFRPLPMLANRLKWALTPS